MKEQQNLVHTDYFLELDNMLIKRKTIIKL